MSAGLGLFRLRWLCVIFLQSTLGVLMAKAEEQEWNKASVCKWFSCPAHIMLANVPVAKACHMSESRVNGRRRIVSTNVISLLYLAPPYPLISLLCIGFTLQFRECRFWRFPLPNSLLLAERTSKLYTFYQFTYIYTVAQNQNIFASESHWHKKESLRGWKEPVYTIDFLFFEMWFWRI